MGPEYTMLTAAPVVGRNSDTERGRPAIIVDGPIIRAPERPELLLFLYLFILRFLKKYIAQQKFCKLYNIFI
jgi:hypothetical protein